MAMKAGRGKNSKSLDKTSFTEPADVLNIVLDHITQGMVVVGPEYRMLAFNRHFEEMFQLSPGTVEVGVDFREILKTWAEVTGQDRQMLDRAIFRLDEPATFQVEFPQLISGERRWCLMTHNPLQGKGFVRTFTDITDPRQAEECLRKSEEKLKAYLHNISDTVWLIDADLNMAYVSPSVTRLMGVFPEEIIGRPSAAVIHPEDMGVVTNAQSYVMEHPGEPHTIQYRISHKNGSWIHVESTGINMLDNPVINGVLVTMRDITERKRAEEALRKSESLLREAQIIAGLGSYILDIPTGSWTCSDVLAKLFGIDGAYERSVDGWAALVHPEDRTMMVDYFKNEVLGRGGTFDKEYRIVRHDDQAERWVYGTGKLEFDIQGRPLKMHGTIQDITDRKKMEEQLRQSQKLEAIGTLAGGIAHDFNNLLQGVFGYLSIAKLHIDNKDKTISALAQAEKALHMSVNLTTQLLTFSKGGKPVKKNISLQSVIENSARFALSGSSADYQLKLDLDLWLVEADEGQIGQVIQNIVLNADQAMPLGGTIVIAAKNLRAPKKGIPQLTEEGKYVEISVQDNGIGISEEYLSKIFDPYFTTKAKGSGLGLATCYSIIKNHGGVIHVTSKVGWGTTVYVYLPAVEAGEEVLPVPELSPIVRKGKILLMDDEELIRDIAGEMIEVLGHDVELAEHGEAAIEKYKAAAESGNPFDIVILDLTIRGGMGGRETIERLLAVNPKIKAIVSSGYSEDAVVSDYHNYGFSARLTKPYKLQELSDTLNSLLSK